MLERVLGNDVDFVFVNTLSLAREALVGNPRLQLIICGVHFDESRMYDLLSYVRQRHPHVRFLCVRVLDAEMSAVSRESVRMAMESLGARLVDYAGHAAVHGVEAADEQLRAAVLPSLHSAQAREM